MLGVLWATLAAIGASFLVGGAVLAALSPFRFAPVMRFLPAATWYDSFIVLLALSTAAGAAVGSAVAFSRGGRPAVVLFFGALLAVAAAGIAPVLELRSRWSAAARPVPLLDLADPVVLSHLPALAAAMLGVAVAMRFIGRRRGSVGALEAAGAYWLAATAIMLPTLGLEPRVLPYSQSTLPMPWHAFAVSAAALVVGVVLSLRDRPLIRTAAIAAGIGLAGAAPVEIMALTSMPGRYLPVSLLLVPLLSGAIAVGVRLLWPLLGRGRSRLAALDEPSRLRLAALGGAGAVLAVGGLLALLLTIPSPYVRDVSIDGFRRTGDERKIVVNVTVGRGDEIVGYTAHEDPRRVTVSVRARQRPGWNDLIGISLPVVITLRDPLGDRTVLDERYGQRVLDGDALARREVGVIEPGSLLPPPGPIDVRWTDSKGLHALADLRGSTVVVLSRSDQGASKMSLLVLEGYLAKASDDERARTTVFVISFDRRDAFASADERFRALFADPTLVPKDAPEILQPAGGPVVWFIGPDGAIRERIIGHAASSDEVARALAEARR